jgi:hypothetical protein
LRTRDRLRGPSVRGCPGKKRAEFAGTFQIFWRNFPARIGRPEEGGAFAQAFQFFCEVSRARKGRRAIIVPVRVLVEFRPAGASLETLGTFTAAPDELAALRSVLERHDNPYDALNILPKGLLFDTLDILRSAGHEARLAFLEDH